jgi:hypothetical protein
MIEKKEAKSASKDLKKRAKSAHEYWHKLDSYFLCNKFVSIVVGYDL